MKASENFKTAIENYLNQTALADAVFARDFSKESKNLESCCNYIFGEVKKTGLCAFDNQEIFDMAVKYYTDESIGQPQLVNCRVVASPPAKADLFTSVVEVPQNTAVVKTAVIAPKAESKILTLFDL
ncbi:Cas9 inhibitor AcrIIA9 family protein [Flavobacterium sp. KACC 22763]|uniref:Cas9 inhibitor AcrIIA9 family protein n=1 Tax=Flavobacterium sp. KACC 22763 TaxID=3025668 RepID=UPI0023660DE3|nr:Cas9 inhibitor AcrIIA9 family protein [Flavobacterium sp. KACC 22763]WDF66129.1 Cas9 inhibitor AcrIIA9 family protein [Flavobacterium sp. KACC 22763]